MGLVTIILDESGIKELITKEYKVDTKDIRFIHGYDFVSAMFGKDEDEEAIPVYKA